MQDVAASEGTHDGRRNHVEDKANDALVRARRYIAGNLGGIEGCRVDVHANTGFDDVDHDQTNHQGDRRDDFEVEQRVTTRLADRLHALHTGDTAHYRAEDDGGDDHFDQLDKAVTQWLQRLGCVRVEVAEKDTQSDRDDHLEIQRFVERRTGSHSRFLKRVARHPCRDAHDTTPRTLL